MHIAMIGPRMPYPHPKGGIDFYVRELSEYLIRQGNRITIYCHQKPPFLPSPFFSMNQFNVTWTPNRRHWDTFFHGLLASIQVLFRDVDVVHYHGGSALFSWIPRLVGKKVVVTFHSRDWLHTHLRKVIRLFHLLAEWIGFQCAHRVGAVSKTIQKTLEAKHAKKVFLVPLGMPPPSDLKPDRLPPFGLKPKNYILSLGRLERGKGLEILLATFQSLSKEIPYPLVIAGRPLHDENYLETLKKQAPPNVLFVGEVLGEAKQKILADCLLYVQASLHEGLSLSLLEALNQGCAVLVSDIPPNKEAVGNAGFYFKNQDGQDFVLQLKKILPRRAELEKMGERGRQKIQEEFSWKRRGPAILDLYRNL